MYYCIGLSQFLRWSSDHFQIKISWILWGKWTILRLFYWGVYCAKMCIFFRYCTYLWFYRTSPIFRWEIQTSPEQIFFNGVNGIFQAYLVDIYVEHFFWDISHVRTYRKTAKMCLAPPKYKYSLKISWFVFIFVYLLVNPLSTRCLSRNAGSWAQLPQS